MRQFVRISGRWLPVLLFATACSDANTPAAPSQPSALPASGPTALDAGGRRILMLDQCDPDSFNAVIGPNTCINRNGGVTFDLFIALLEKSQLVPSWRFSPDTIHVPRDLTLPIVNSGGEVHTFTEVAQFGGGIVPVLNQLSGNPVAAPECLALSGSDFIAPGGQATHTFEPGESDKYQCCIHPWMRATTR